MVSKADVDNDHFFLSSPNFALLPVGIVGCGVGGVRGVGGERGVEIWRRNRGAPLIGIILIGECVVSGI